MYIYIRGNRYNLLLDESNGISILKVSKVSVIYYGNNCEKVLSTWLDHMQIKKCNVENIVSALMAFLSHNKFDV